MSQSAVMPAMTAWAVSVLRDPQKFPMFATTIRVFEGLTVLARVEWHAPDSRNPIAHRGVTLYSQGRGGFGSQFATGIDVSHYQPVVDWEKVAASRIAFAFIKATEGTALLDHSFANHWSGAKRASVLRGAYHFFRPKQDAVAQAKFFLAQLDDPGELPPIVDVEAADGVAPSQIADGILAWIDVVTSGLGRPLIYTSPSFWNLLGSTDELASKADLWVAHWGAHEPATVTGWGRWTFWQFTNRATVPGIAAPLHVDENRFNGTLDALRTYSTDFVASRVRSITTNQCDDAARS
jgi:lysozyme